MIPTKAQLEQAVDDGLTQIEAAKRIGCGSATVQRYAKRHGVRWPSKAEREARYAVVRGQRMSLREIAAEYGIPWQTVAKRWERGLRGNDLAHPVKHYRQAPDVYELDKPMTFWMGVRELATARSPDKAARDFDVPIGAVNAAVRGEWERLA